MSVSGSLRRCRYECTEGCSIPLKCVNGKFSDGGAGQCSPCPAGIASRERPLLPRARARARSAHSLTHSSNSLLQLWRLPLFPTHIISHIESHCVPHAVCCRHVRRWLRWVLPVHSRGWVRMSTRQHRPYWHPVCCWKVLWWGRGKHNHCPGVLHAVPHWQVWCKRWAYCSELQWPLQRSRRVGLPRWRHTTVGCRVCSGSFWVGWPCGLRGLCFRHIRGGPWPRELLRGLHVQSRLRVPARIHQCHWGPLPRGLHQCCWGHSLHRVSPRAALERARLSRVPALSGRQVWQWRRYIGELHRNLSVYSRVRATGCRPQSSVVVRRSA